jgi:cyclopropane-fatty-acyl-phospholipid synthase
MARSWLSDAFLRAFSQAGIGTGQRPHDLRIHDRRLWRRVAIHGPVGLGDAYVDGWWDCDAIDQFFDRAFRADLPAKLRFCPSVLVACASDLIVNHQTRRRARHDIHAHYDLGNDLFEAMLDRRMVYSCAYWDQATTLDEAQEAKLDLICRKLHLRPGLSLLDIGCGWGGLARFAAERFGCSVVGVTLSPSQAEVARERTGCRSRSASRTIAMSPAGSTAWFRSGCSSTSARGTTARSCSPSGAS